MLDRLRSTAKTQIRHISRAAGYDIVPVAAGLASIQRQILAGIAVVVDVGANVGQFGERLFDLGFAGDVISFEPGSAAFAILRRKAASRSQWEVRQAALGARSGTAQLRIAANSVSSSLLDVGELHLQAAPKSRTIEHEEVRVGTLDEELADVDCRAFYLKLDVQGLELPVLLGGAKTLECSRAVQVEVSFDDLYDGQSNWIELCGYLQRCGFVVRYLENGYEDQGTGYMLQADFLFMRR